jgi:hypothetical protein
VKLFDVIEKWSIFIQGNGENKTTENKNTDNLHNFNIISAICKAQ